MSSPRLTLFSRPANAKEQKCKTVTSAHLPNTPSNFSLSCKWSDIQFGDETPGTFVFAVSGINLRFLLFIKTIICKPEWLWWKPFSRVPVAGCYKSLLALSVCLPVMFTYIPLWHLEAEGSAQEGKSLNKHGRCPGGSVVSGPHPEHLWVQVNMIR